ncbi:D-alanine--D-alanine ligase family protein [Sediminivirga luteola]|uniref:D-alanine--D-alanine ligase n=1 Tax=Sediminivirga luteola TaxID=1774748 RepID=A0A8J2TV85_9MICO|nr:D-alanine--D-alanine ligase family protein [Sediminivirga luteola]GGA03046.1 D-alanine--D-alanine ligase [Sediminivirga luteola]
MNHAMNADGSAGGASAARRPRVAVLFGGRSDEHPVSCVTAAGVLSAIDPEKYDVLAIGITRQGTWRLVPDAVEFAFSGGKPPEVTEDGSAVYLPLSADGAAAFEVTAEGERRSLGVIDVVFPVLHGPYGEDGTVQGLLELSDTRYVGAGVFTSSASMDKHYMKVVLEAAGLPVAPYAVITETQWRHDRERSLERALALGEVLFVKPARAGSSIGISKVTGREELLAAVEAARQHDRKVLVEPQIVGREIECGVLAGLGGAAPEASLLGEIVVSSDREFYDYEAKYLDGSAVDLRCPAEVDRGVQSAVQDAAVRTFEAFGCEGMARVDCFVLEDGGVLVNELNTLPGFTPSSMFPLMWKATGLSYPALVDRLLALALERSTGLR